MSDLRDDITTDVDDAAPNPFAETNAEWTGHARIARLFVPESNVISRLLQPKSTVLTGSVGSGKSTYLKIISEPGRRAYYEFQRSHRNEVVPLHVDTPYFGVYIDVPAPVLGQEAAEQYPHYDEAFRVFLHTLVAEAMLDTLIRVLPDRIKREALRHLLQGVGRLLLHESVSDNPTLVLGSLRDARGRTAVALLNPPFAGGDSRADVSTMDRLTDLLHTIDEYQGHRLHVLIDNFDRWSHRQQDLVYRYMMQRNIAMKIAGVGHIIGQRPIVGPVDPTHYEVVSLDGKDYGRSPEFVEHLVAIADRRLAVAELDVSAREWLGKTSKGRLCGFERVAELSSGICRVFIEILSGIYKADSKAVTDGRVVPCQIQRQTIEDLAEDRWRKLTSSTAVDPSLPTFIMRLTDVLRQQPPGGTARFAITDAPAMSGFIGHVVGSALEQEALLEGPREHGVDVESRNFMLHGLVAAHCSISLSKHQGFRITAQALEQLVLRGDMASLRQNTEPTRTDKAEVGLDAKADIVCPVRTEPCPVPTDTGSVVFVRDPGVNRPLRNAQDILMTRMVSDGLILSDQKLDAGLQATDPACNACFRLSRSGILLADVTLLPPNVLFDVGYALGRGFTTYLIAAEQDASYTDAFSKLGIIHYPTGAETVKRFYEDRLEPALRHPGKRTGAVQWAREPFVERNSSKSICLLFPDDPIYDDVGEAAASEVRRRGYQAVRVNGLDTFEGLVQAGDAVSTADACLVDITHGGAARVLLAGLALGYAKPQLNIIDVMQDSTNYLRLVSSRVVDRSYDSQSDVVILVRELLTRLPK